LAKDPTNSACTVYERHVKALKWGVKAVRKWGVNDPDNTGDGDHQFAFFIVVLPLASAAYRTATSGSINN
jgi:hypothetical protein